MLPHCYPSRKHPDKQASSTLLKSAFPEQNIEYFLAEIKQNLAEPTYNN